jgi:hypothetical protein
MRTPVIMYSVKYEDNFIVAIAVLDCGIIFTKFKSASVHYVAHQGLCLTVYLRTL